VRSTYLQLARESSGRYRLIDASQSLDIVETKMLEVCSELLSCWKVRQGTQ
jgi:dTMP kinase